MSRWSDAWGRVRRSGHGVDRAAKAHLAEFVAEHSGVECYLEPETTDTPFTVVLIADTGAWTRRPVADGAQAEALARALGVPLHNVLFTGYPDRMRMWNSVQRDLDRLDG